MIKYKSDEYISIYIEKIKALGNKNVFWLPLACDPEIHGKKNISKQYEISFVGSIGDKNSLRNLRGIEVVSNEVFQ